MRAHESRLVQLGVILFVVLGLVAIHSVEIWLYGAAYWAIGAVSDFETALYFSTVTFTTLGLRGRGTRQQMAAVRRHRGRQRADPVRLVDGLPAFRHQPAETARA